MTKQKQHRASVGTAHLAATKKNEAQMLDGTDPITWHLNATCVSFGSAALTHLLLLEAWVGDNSLAGPGTLEAALHFALRTQESE